MDRRHLLTALGVTASMGLAGCTSGDPDDAGEENVQETTAGDGDQATEASTDSPTPEPREVDAFVGERVDGENLSLVVEGLERTTELGRFSEADEGNEFVVVALAMKNTTDGYIAVSNLLQLRLRDEAGTQYTQTVAGSGEAGGRFDGGEFAPGEVERGRVVFEVPEDAGGLTLVFDLDPSIFGGVERVHIDLTEESDELSRLEQELAVELRGVGDAVEQDGITCGVTEFRTATELGQFTEADEGNEFVILHLEIANETGEEQRLSLSLQSQLKDGEGRSYRRQVTAETDLDRAFDDTTALGDGATRTGGVVYQAPEGISPLYWAFEFSLFGEGTKTFWELR